jgi:hypothetical protein
MHAMAPTYEWLHLHQISMKGAAVAAQVVFAIVVWAIWRRARPVAVMFRVLPVYAAYAVWSGWLFSYPLRETLATIVRGCVQGLAWALLLQWAYDSRVKSIASKTSERAAQTADRADGSPDEAVSGDLAHEERGNHA